MHFVKSLFLITLPLIVPASVLPSTANDDTMNRKRSDRSLGQTLGSTQPLVRHIEDSLSDTHTGAHKRQDEDEDEDEDVNINLGGKASAHLDVKERTRKPISAGFVISADGNAIVGLNDTDEINPRDESSQGSIDIDVALNEALHVALDERDTDADVPLHARSEERF